ncbi:MAG: hypothetical protein U0324_37840 [Polyangiales bacterium]
MNPLGRGLALASLAASCAGPSPRERFDADVAPVLARRCANSACHEARSDGRTPRALTLRVDSDGRLTGNALDDAYAAAKRFINTAERPEFSSLLRKALPPETGGLPHAGGAAFYGRGDPAFVAVRAWIAAERGGGEDGRPEELTEGERFFAREVQPRLAEAQCMSGPCHGAASGVPLRFDPGVDGAFSVAATRANHREAVTQLALGGHPELSRLARKPLRDLAQALPHRGGNGVGAFPRTLDDPLPRAVVAWAALERRLRTDGAPTGVAGIAFVGGPMGPARVHEHAAFVPGSDVFLLTPAAPGGALRNLTAALHPAPADVRDPAVDSAGERLAFTLREAPGAPRVVWELDLRTGAGRALTRGVRLPDGGGSSDRWPAYAPDGRLWFVSDRAGVLAEHGDGYDTDLYVLERDGSLTRRSFTPSPELATTFFRQGRETSGAVAFTAIRRLGDGYKGVVYRFPNDLHAEYHQHVGITLGDDVTWHVRETADGNYVGLLLDRDAVWSAGALVHIDRNLGIALPTSVASSSSLTGYQSPIAYLGPYGDPADSILNPYAAETVQQPVRRLQSDGAWRDPHPLPDGRVLAAWADGPVRLRDRDAAPDFGLYAVTLARDPASGVLHVERRERLVDLPGVPETQPVPVFRDVPGVVYGDAARGDRGTILYGGVPMVESLLRQVGPFGLREPRDDLRAVRILGWIPRAADPLHPPAPGLPTPQRRSGVGPHLPARVLAEIPLEEDGTLYASLPAGTAFRLQYLDARGMAVGVQHNRWFDLQGGQELRQGVSASVYDVRCAACHGARSGRAEAAFLPVDVTARASRSLARFEHDDPDRPRAPFRVEGALPAGWSTVVSPALSRSCAAAGCHDDGTRAAGLSLTATPTARYDVAYESLVALGEGSRHGFRYVDVTGTSARGSHLVERVLGEELDAPRSTRGAPPHRGSPPLDDASLRALVRWIEAGAAWRDEVTP